MSSDNRLPARLPGWTIEDDRRNRPYHRPRSESHMTFTRPALPLGVALSTLLCAAAAGAQTCGGPTYRVERPGADAPYSYEVRAAAPTTYSVVSPPRRTVQYREVVAPVTTNLFYDPIDVRPTFVQITESDVRRTATCASPTAAGNRQTVGFVSDIKAIIDLLDCIGQRPGHVPPPAAPAPPSASAELVARLNGLEARVAALEAKGSGGGSADPGAPGPDGIPPRSDGTRPIERDVSARRQTAAAAGGDPAVALLNQINGKLDGLAAENARIRDEMRNMMREHERVHHSVVADDVE